MKLTKITNIEILTATEAFNLKGGARDTRGTTTGTASAITIETTTGKKKK